MKNKKAQTMGLAVLSFIAVFIIGFLFINFLMPEVTIFRASMSCADVENISDGTKLMCLFGDIVVPYTILIVLGLAISAITRRLSL
jgi:hypothetical protein